MKKKEQLSESLEDYLEIILALEKINKVARTKDIAEKMGVQRSTVTGALKSLSEKGMINYEPYSFITLTKKGVKIAKDVTRRHKILKDFLYRVLQLDDKNADNTACRMEHAMDKKSFERFVQFIDFLDTCPKTSFNWKETFFNFREGKEPDREACRKCLTEFISSSPKQKQ
ncbi:DtxR family transcriptional regulator, Mn-dependent transcriptional regulator [Desulfosarcina sp. BuS5]|uniref:metal-dependent transcriptional regulator n=1 Tax=Desulfosarcina sp. BuS5 TaxID=933262 RepID=UPI0005578457|nr:metal-dependent transcriptional regulator [Desulfosarcina sp. BuS5]WDN87222.1 DtxR family transcriptional regulator, Mn-dependent transcriptional regulator [Desulfosarcina sp. BuS5]